MSVFKAWIVEADTRDLKLVEREVQMPDVSEVLVKVLATGLNFADLLMIDGTYQDTPQAPFTPGMEIAGQVAAIGEDVAGLEIGDFVMGLPGQGGLAEYALLPAQDLQLAPASMTSIQAAAFQVAYGTSHLVLTRRAQLRKGETLLVLGAAGGVGLTAVEIGKLMGAHVVAVARGEHKLKIAESAGADAVIDSDAPDVSETVASLGKIDVVYDSVGGALGEAALRAMSPEGRYLVIGFASGKLPTLKPNHLLVKNQTVVGFYWGGYKRFQPNALSESLQELGEWHASGKIEPHVSHVLPLEDALLGLKLLKERKSTGKIVITP